MGRWMKSESRMWSGISRISSRLPIRFGLVLIDLRLRGPGDLQGTQQSGIIDLRLSNLVRDEKILKYARNLAADILTEDPNLQMDKNWPLAKQLQRMNREMVDWGVIS